MSKLEPPDLLAYCTREGALLVAEQLTLQQTCGDGGTVHLDEVAFGTAAQVVDSPGDEFFSSSSLPKDEDRGVGGSHDLNTLHDDLESRTLADQFPIF